jgi:hypothetical protein
VVIANTATKHAKRLLRCGCGRSSATHLGWPRVRRAAPRLGPIVCVCAAGRHDTPACLSFVSLERPGFAPRFEARTLFGIVRVNRYRTEFDAVTRGTG